MENDRLDTVDTVPVSTEPAGIVRRMTHPAGTAFNCASQHQARALSGGHDALAG